MTVPWPRRSVARGVPVAGTSDGGRPTSLTCGLPPASGSQRHWAVPACGCAAPTDGRPAGGAPAGSSAPDPARMTRKTAASRMQTTTAAMAASTAAMSHPLVPLACGAGEDCGAGSGVQDGVVTATPVSAG
ncbi:hypothetical protein ACFQY4_32010 [Catellatospora bangladeshensis]|uniref:hypothetical protein n=1 Tax=Catellatospora bangladeshensis TaxID=310355 RepID=UPI00360963A7